MGTVIPFPVKTAAPVETLAEAGWRCLLCPTAKDCQEFCPPVHEAMVIHTRAEARREVMRPRPPEDPEGKGA
jgi:hypothetical protein